MQNNNFDMLRLIAAFQVLLGHATHHLFSEQGFSIHPSILLFQKVIHYIPGVPIFFLISGFLIAMSYEKNSNLKEYAKNRMLRIYPALYVNIFLGIIILYWFGYITFNSQFFFWLLAQMTIVQFYNPEMFRSFGVGVINGSLWTISIELTFYIALPILFFLYRKSRLFIIVLFICSLALWLYDIYSIKDIFFNKLLHVSIFPYLFLFIMGMTFYKFYHALASFLQDKFLWWLLIYGTFAGVIEFYGLTSNNIILLIQWVVFAFFIFAFAFSFRDLSKKFLRGNDYTYGVYIYHMLIINVFVQLRFVGQIEYLGYLLLLSLLSGVLSWHLIEKPFLKLKKHSLFVEMHR